MNIKYFNNGERTIGKAEFDSFAPAGISTFLVGLVALDPCTSGKEKRILTNHSTMEAHAEPKGDDRYDQYIGRAVVRDKLVIRQCNRDLRKLHVLIRWMENQLEHLKNQRTQLGERRERAVHRLHQEMER